MRLGTEHWRQRAQEARHLAGLVEDPDLRDALLQIAQSYSKQASSAALDEMEAGLPPPRSRTHGPGKS